MGTGKTKELLSIAAKNNGQVLTTNKAALQVKAKSYGIDVPIIDLYDLSEKDYDLNKQIYINKIEDIALELMGLPMTSVGGFSIRMEN